MNAEKPVLGREHPRRKYVCESCGVRRAIGEPRATETWPQRLWLSREQVNALLEAAAEYRQLTAEAGEAQDAVQFLDWCSVDALRRGAA